MLSRLLLSVCLCACTHAAAPRLAIVESSLSIANITFLLNASLSKNQSVSLLERAELDKILRERSLAATQFTNVLTATRILGADGVVLLGATGGATNLSINVRLVSVKEGAVVYATRSGSDLTNILHWVDIVSSHLVATAAKISADRGKVVPISVLNFRSPNASPASELLDRELTSLALLRLSREPNLLVLERRKLLDIAFEKDLAAQAEQFWSGAYLLDGIINKQGVSPDRATLSARLIAPDKSVINIEAAGARTNLAAIVDDLLAQTLQSLKLNNSKGWDAQREAQQFAEEAEWSLRWGMFPEAQAAADSAWALGFRTRAVAMNRTLAYVRDYAAFRPKFAFGGSAYTVHVEQPPSLERFESVYRGVTIIHEFLASDPEAVSYANVYPVVCEILKESGNTLQGYHFCVEAREGLEDRLADLRTMSRKIEATTRANPTVRRPFWTAEASGLDRNKIYRYLNGTNFVVHTTMYTGMFQETPEAAIEVYRDLVTADSFPFLRGRFANRSDKPPLVSGWKVKDRNRSNAAWDGFVRELIASTDLFTHVEGRMLELRDQTDWPTYKRKFEELFTYLEKHSSELIGRRPAMLLHDLTAIPFRGDAPIKEVQSFDREVTQRVVDDGFIESILLNGELIVSRKNPPKTNAPTAKNSRMPETSPIAKIDPLTVKDFWRAEAVHQREGSQLLSPIYREGQLWVRLTSPTSELGKLRSEVVAVDLQSRRTTRAIPVATADLPTPFISIYLNDYMHLSKSIEVSSNALFVVEGSSLHRFDLGNNSHSTIAIPEFSPDIYQVNGRLYLSSTNSIYELRGDGEARLLASARRRPSASLLDELDSLNCAPLTPGPNGTLRAFAQGNAYLWKGDAWTRETEIGKLDAITSDTGGFLATVGFPSFVQLHSFSPNERKSHYLAAALVPTNDPQVLRDQTNRWLLKHNQILHGAPAFVGDTPVLYLQATLTHTEDANAASLIVLDDTLTTLVEIPLRFDNAAARPLRDAYDRGLRRPWLLDTPAGLVIGHHGFTGFCLIPRNEIDAALAAATRVGKKPIQTSALPKP